MNYSDTDLRYACLEASHHRYAPARFKISISGWHTSVDLTRQQRDPIDQKNEIDFRRTQKTFSATT